MNQYRLIKQKVFETTEKFETRLNDECGRGWRVVNLAGNGNGLVALLERETRV